MLQLSETGMAKPEIPEPQPAELAFEAFKEIVRRAIMTLLALKDPDRRWQSMSDGWLLSTVRDAREAYGYSEYRWEPSAHDISQMEVVAGWLAWLRRTEGEGALRRIIAWTLAVPWWKLGQRERCSERTVRNRLDRSMASMVQRFASVDLSVEEVEDSKVATPYAMVLEKPSDTDGPVVLRKIYIYDQGFMIGSRKWRDGREKAEKLEARYC